MASRDFNDAESFLLKNWPVASRLEKSLKSIRDKYQLLCEQVVEDFQRRRPEFNAKRIRVSHRSVDWGYLYLSKQSWPKDGTAASGIWIENIRLEYLADDEKPPPLASIWLGPLEKEPSFQKLKEQIRRKADTAFPKGIQDTLAKTLPEPGYVLGLEFIDKQAMVLSLVEPNSKRFCDTLSEQLDVLAQFSPLIDGLVATREPIKS